MPTVYQALCRVFYIHSFTVSPKAYLSAGLEGLSDFLETVNDWPRVHTMAFPMIWLVPNHGVTG